MSLISNFLDRRIPQTLWSCMIPLLILADPAGAQVDNDFSPRTFHGAPLVASVQSGPSKQSGASVFRNYRYDSNGLLLVIEQGSDSLGVTLEVTFESDAGGRPVKASAVFMGNLGWTESYSYDEKGRLDTWTKLNPRTGVETVSRRHVYDEEGRQVKTIFVRAGRDAEETTRSFDASNRLLQEETTSEGEFVRRTSYEYDASGCLAKQVAVRSKGRVEVQVWKRGENCRADQRTTRTFGGKANVVDMTYDEKGNLVSESTLRDGASTPEVMSWTYEFAKAVPETVETTQ